MKVLVSYLLLGCVLFGSEYINFGSFEKDRSIFTQKDMSLLSEKFLGVRYVSHTLSNKEIDTSKENLIINFESLDCFTFIDTLRALKYSKNKKEFRINLIETRYKNSDISYFSRNHFFSDWILKKEIKDITCEVGQCQKVIKYLNKDEKYLQKIPMKKREISYIALDDIDTSKLKNGDYIGIYTDKNGLDVTHTGILIKKNGTIYLRHASSLEKKIIDSKLFEYAHNRMGIIIYRDL